MKWPVDPNKYRITQHWGENPKIYARFGLKGHNGIDFATPNGTFIYAPHNGTIKEKRFDKNGYGKYIKIESLIEGSVLAHFQEFAVNINQKVKQGQLVGYADNTGFSTGPHLHWGYYKIPRNRNDGYLGYINQLPLMTSSQDGSNELKSLLKHMKVKSVEEAKKVWTQEMNNLKKDRKRKQELEIELYACEQVVKTRDKKIKVLEDRLFAIQNGSDDVEVLKQQITKLKLQLKHMINPKKTSLWDFIKLKYAF